MKYLVWLIGVLITFESEAIQFNFLGTVLGAKKIKSFSNYRSYANGSFAKNCNEYKNPIGGYQYSGEVGDGVYRIKPDSNPAFDVYCDMTTDNGGWTLVLEGRGNIFPGGSELASFDSKINSCLLDSVVNCPVNAMYWQTKSIVGNSYMKKLGTLTSHMVIQLNQNVNWGVMSDIRIGDTRFLYTYLSENPAIHYSGYSADASGAAGCQDTATLGYLFPLSNGNTLCGGSFNFLYPGNDGGFHNGLGSNQDAQIFVR